MISQEKFLEWVQKRFKNEFIHNKSEIRLNSVFVVDNNYHLYCNPYGGRKKIEDGVYQCFKSGKKGTLVGLVMHVESITYQEAKELLDDEFFSLENFEEKLEEIFSIKSEPPVVKKPGNLPECVPACENEKAANYLKSRGLKCDNLFFCTTGDYRDRIIIPYYNKKGDLIYFNARTINKKTKVRYKNPSANSFSASKSEVVYLTSWALPGSRLYLTEGEFDALTLQECGLFAGALGGKEISEKQITLISEYDICLALDLDFSGSNALVKISQKLIDHGLKVSFVRPAHKFKDWNKMLESKITPTVIKKYIEKYEKPIDQFTLDKLKIKMLDF